MLLFKVFLHFFIFWNLFFTRDQYCYVPSLFLHCFNGLTSRTYNCHQTIYKESSNSSMNCICWHKDLLQKCQFWKLVLPCFQRSLLCGNIGNWAFSYEDLEVKDRSSEDWFSLVDAERERPFRTTNPTASWVQGYCQNVLTGGQLVLVN
jgi:hypothetical protein